MTREEEIRKAAVDIYPLPPLYNEEQRRSKEYAECYKRARDQQFGFIHGAKWVDEHPNAIDMAYLQNWYQDSVDETREPMWTDKHLEELFNDFYLTPKVKG